MRGRKSSAVDVNTGSFAFFVKQRREALGMTQKDAATLAGISVAEVCRIERNDRKSSSLNLTVKLMKALKVSYVDALGHLGYEVSSDALASLEAVAVTEWVTPVNAVEFGDFIKQKRESLGMTQKELATISNISVAEVCRIEVKDRKNPSMHMVVDIMRGLKVTPQELLNVLGYPVVK